MNLGNSIEITKAEEKHRQAIVILLKKENLPVEDLPFKLDNFFIAQEEEKVIGAIGLEKYGHCGLLRSMVVDSQYRNKGLASQLVEELENRARAFGIESMYLLTETAPAYFERKGYKRINRTQVPLPVQASSEYSSVCPVSAIIMKKTLSTL